MDKLGIKINEVEKNFMKAGIAIKKSLLTSEEMNKICKEISKAYKERKWIIYQ